MGAWICAALAEASLYVWLPRHPAAARHWWIAAVAIAVNPIVTMALIAFDAPRSRSVAVARALAAAGAVVVVEMLIVGTALYRWEIRATWTAEFQLFYVFTALLLTGVAGAITFAVSRVPSAVDNGPRGESRPPLRWRMAIESWLAVAALDVWLLGFFQWRVSVTATQIPPFVILPAMAVLILGCIVVPLAALAYPSPTRARAFRQFAVVGCGATAAVQVGWVTVIYRNPILAVIVVAMSAWLWLFFVFAIMWAGLLAVTLDDAPLVTRPASRRFAASTAAAHALALYTAVLVSAPAGTGVAGKGCTERLDGHVNEYFFWKAYAGVSDEHRNGPVLLFRPVSDRTVCVVVDLTREAPRRPPSAELLGQPLRHDVPLEMQTLRDILGQPLSSAADWDVWWLEHHDHLVLSADRMHLTLNGRSGR